MPFAISILRAIGAMCFPCAMSVRRTGQVKTAAKCCALIFASTALLHATPSDADESFSYVSATGSGTTCSVSQPCASYFYGVADADRVRCFNPLSDVSNFTDPVVNSTKELDCPGGIFSATSGDVAISFTGANQTLKIRNMTFSGGSGGTKAFLSSGNGGTFIFENCVFEGFAAGPTLDIEPSGPVNLVIRNSRISNNGSGFLLKPAAGGSIKATFDHVVVTGNGGGGIKTDSTNGTVNLDITDSEISNNAANGINLVGNANQNMLNLSRTVIAKNALTGLQINGATAAALVDTTLFDTNAAGATTVVNGGHILTYGNNRIVGTAGSGFTGSAGLQ